VASRSIGQARLDHKEAALAEIARDKAPLDQERKR
jgi:hypothetical protein